MLWALGWLWVQFLIIQKWVYWVFEINLDGRNLNMFYFLKKSVGCEHQISFPMVCCLSKFKWMKKTLCTHHFMCEGGLHKRQSPPLVSFLNLVGLTLKSHLRFKSCPKSSHIKVPIFKDSQIHILIPKLAMMNIFTWRIVYFGLIFFSPLHSKVLYDIPTFPKPPELRAIVQPWIRKHIISAL